MTHNIQPSTLKAYNFLVCTLNKGKNATNLSSTLFNNQSDNKMLVG